jgi:hypothetical protein
MIDLRHYEDLAAMAVLQALDPNDRIEAELIRGAATTHLALFADWRAVQPVRVGSWVIHTSADRGAKPFALLALCNSGQAGVAEAALLARNHRVFRRQLALLAAVIRAEMPAFCARAGIHRIEARCWAGHPTAARLLSALGFTHEADMPGFGPGGTVTYRQFAWISPAIPRQP